MKNQLIKTTALSLAANAILSAGGYKIPETSVNGVALSSANVAHAKSADAAYYNPANMSFMKDENFLEVDLMYVGLNATNFKGSGSMSGIDTDAESETFFIPSINYVSPKFGDFRLGLSVVVPGGLTKRWTESPAVDKAEEFSLQIVEVNPTLSYLINDKVALALGLRVIHSEGIVKSSSLASRDMIGEGVDYGYNLALSYKPAAELEVALTYRSNIDLTEEGNAKLYVGDAIKYNGGTSVTVPLPATASVALAYTLPSETTIEFVYNRNYWSAYETLDFDYTSTLPAIIQPSFDGEITKDWKDTNAFRLGVTQELEDVTLMAGAVYDQSPVPDDTLSFELPDSDSISVSLGGRYQMNKEINFGMSVLYSMRDTRSAKNADIEGEFSNSNVLLVAAGIEYKF